MPSILREPDTAWRRSLEGRLDLAHTYLDRAEEHLVRGHHPEALRAIQTAISTDVSHVIAHPAVRLARRLDASAAGVTIQRVAILSDNNLGPLPTILASDALSSSILIETYVPDFGTWEIETADPASGLFAFDPHVAIVDVNLARRAPALATALLSLDRSAISNAIDTVASAVQRSITRLQDRVSCRVIIHSIPPPAHSPLGVLDPDVSTGYAATYGALNAALRDIRSTMPNVHVLEMEPLVRAEGVDRFFDPRTYALAKIPYSSLGLRALGREHFKYIRALCGRTKKVLALDADNTLWRGIVGEDGVDGIGLDRDSTDSGYLELQEYVAELARRGVVLVMNSNNDEADVHAVFDRRQEMILRWDDFVARRINWSDKAENLSSLAEELGMSTDAFVFVDDDPAQCARIRHALPATAVVELSQDPLSHRKLLAEGGWFDSLSFSEEDRQRTDMYRSELRRQTVERTAPSLESFLASLDMRLEVRHVTPDGVGRAAALTQRTNQFNLTTRRYSTDDITAMLGQDDTLVLSGHLIDRFGDLGVVGLVIIKVRGAEALIDTLVVSCRALRRGVEDALLAAAQREARGLGANTLIGRYVPTARNAQTADLYPRLKFRPSGRDSDGGLTWTMEEDLPTPPAMSLTMVPAE